MRALWERITYNLATKKLQLLKDKIGKNFLYLMVDETTDTRGQYLANLIIGILDGNLPGESYLLSSKPIGENQLWNNLQVCE